jgi:hypothetical protein
MIITTTQKYSAADANWFDDMTITIRTFGARRILVTFKLIIGFQNNVAAPHYSTLLNIS